MKKNIDDSEFDKRINDYKEKIQKTIEENDSQDFDFDEKASQIANFSITENEYIAYYGDKKYKKYINKHQAIKNGGPNLCWIYLLMNCAYFRYYNDYILAGVGCLFLIVMAITLSPIALGISIMFGFFNGCFFEKKHFENTIYTYRIAKMSHDSKEYLEAVQEIGYNKRKKLINICSTTVVTIVYWTLVFLIVVNQIYH